MTNRKKFYFQTEGEHYPDEVESKEGYEYIYNWNGAHYCIAEHALITKCGKSCDYYTPHSLHSWGRCIYNKRVLIATGRYRKRNGKKYAFIGEENGC